MRYKESFTLLTFYKFVDVENPEAEVSEHLEFCKDIGMKGRIYIGTEGISSTVTGNIGQIKAYKLYLENHPLWKGISDLDIKSSKTDGHQFPRMAVKFREEIVGLGAKYSACEIDKSGNRISVEEFKNLLDNENPENYVILDMRNNHEYKLGHFKNAVPANTVTFKDLEKNLDKYIKDFGDKKIISYCTGGIRCEKSTVMMQLAGLKNTYQLDGGVMKYINTYNDGNWIGNLYVFDDRVSLLVGDEKTHTIIGEDIYTGEKTDNCENCRFGTCNARIIATKKNYKKHFGFCSEECAEKALETLLVKTDLSIDKMDYKKERNFIKSFPNLKEEIETKMRNHILKNIGKIVFNHKESQKEEYLID